MLKQAYKEAKLALGLTDEETQYNDLYYGKTAMMPGHVVEKYKKGQILYEHGTLYQVKSSGKKHNGCVSRVGGWNFHEERDGSGYC